MRIGILTFHNAINHGAVLQAYATQTLLCDMGHEAELIDYRNEAVESYYDNMRFHLGVLLKKRKKRYLLSPILFWLQRRAFSRFNRKHLNVAPKTRKLNEYDLVLAGSDQLWNLQLTGGFDDMFWGNTAAAQHTRIASWAVSAGSKALPIDKEQTERIRTLLRNFCALSVRENSLQERISKLTDMPVVPVLDPTLLLPAERWSALCHKVHTKNYVVAYAVEFWDKREVGRVAKRLAERMGLSLVLIRIYADTGSMKDALHGFGPDDYLSYLKDASYVVTSSFHGTAFALMFKKQFYCVVDPEVGNVRVQDLLIKAGMESRIVGYDADFTNVEDIDYENYDPYAALADERRRSMEFLERVIKK